MRTVCSILFFLLTLSTVPAWAEWTKVTTSTDGVATFYIDFATIRKNGILRRAWYLTALKQRAPAGEMSRRVYYEFNCYEQRSRILHLTAYSAPMGGGQVIGSETNGPWSDVPPNTIAEDMIYAVCR